jgi:hypothetical protein
MTTTSVSRTRNTLRWVGLGEAVIALGVVVWVLATEWGGVTHAHPAYPILLGLTLAVSVGVIVLLAVRPGKPGGRGRLVRRIVVLILAAGWIALIFWLRPHTAVEPALAAMESTTEVTVTETATEIVLEPTGDTRGIGVFFQPGALVDARAYAAVLLPQAEAGHVVVIPKQPLNIAFLALGAFDAARQQHPEVTGWAIGGHSLGGTVAAMQGDSGQHDDEAPAVGLFFYASYPANDLSTALGIPVVSISGSRDGLATPAKIDTSRANLPAETHFTVVEGGNHAQFGAYGPQSGDNPATISDDEARDQIAAATSRFLESLPE